jgi:DNA polymerase
MCELGLSGAERNGEVRDPHVFSNLNPTRAIVVGQNPGWNEVKEREPFVGDAGKTFNEEVAKHGLDRSWFYITNTVKCFTKGNQRPQARHMQRCEPFLRMEINLIKPKIVVALGAVAFDQLCPGLQFTPSLKKLTPSEKYGVKVFAIYHPSPLNFRDPARKGAFSDQVKILCGVLKAIEKDLSIG